MNPKTITDDAAAQAVAKEPPIAGTPPGPIDADWAQRERAARGQRAPDDAEDDDVYGDPSKVKDEGVLDSLGEAVTAPIRDAANEGKAGTEKKR